MKKLLAFEKNDSFKVNTLLTISRRLFSSAPEEAIIYATQANELAKTIKFSAGQAYALKNIGIAYYNKGLYVQSLENYKNSLALFDSLKDKTGSANILSNMGAVYFARADNTKALDYYLKALKISEDIGDKLRMATVLTNIGSIYANKDTTKNKDETINSTIQYYRRALALAEEIKDDYLISNCTVNLGEMYLIKNNFPLAQANLERALKISDTVDLPYVMLDMGKLYSKKGNFITALQYQQEAYDLVKKLDGKLDMAKCLISLADTYEKMGDKRNAITYYNRADTLTNLIGALNERSEIFKGLAKVYAELNDYDNAFKFQKSYTLLKDTINYNKNAQQIASMQFDFNMQKKEGEIDLLTKDKALQEVNLKRQRLTRNALIGGLTLAMTIAIIIYRNYRNKIKTNKILDEQKTEIETLLLNILPADVAHELQKHGVATARYYERASVLFTDIKSFSTLADALSPQEVVTELNECFIAFDNIIEKYNLEKIKTIGDSYMCAGGIPRADDAHIINIIKASLEIQEFIKDRNGKRVAMNLPPWDIRIGINTGPLVAGVVGKKKYAYDIWGGTVNIASRMESNGEAGRVNISEATYELIKHQYACTHRGKIFAKNIGEIDMYFVDAELN
ncbi:MAG: adenylate/guanylate cyclase domain-containing protein [Ferruginibacter sp.]